MSFLSWMLALGVLVYIMIESVAFHRATVCRQEAWLKSTELLTRALLLKPKAKEREWHLGCRLHFTRSEQEVTWQKLPSLKKRHFALSLDGRL